MKNLFMRFVAIILVIQIIGSTGVFVFAEELSDKIDIIIENYIDETPILIEDDLLSDQTVDFVADEVVSESTVGIIDGVEYPEHICDILESHTYYDTLKHNQRHQLKRYFGVREDTMLELYNKGYNIKQSIPKALIMQRLKIDADSAIEMILNFKDEAVAVEESLKLRKAQFDYPYLMDDEVFSKIVSVLVTGVSTQISINSFILSKCMGKSVSELVVDDTVLSSSAITINNFEADDIVITPSALTVSTNEVVTDDLSLGENQYTSMTDFCSTYNVSESVVEEYLNDNDATLSDLQLAISTYTEENQLVSTLSTTDDDEAGDTYNFTGPFVYSNDVTEKVNMNTGALMYTENIVSIAGINGLDLDFGMCYDSGDKYIYSGKDPEINNSYYNVWKLNFTRLANKYGGYINDSYGIKKLILSDGTEYDLYSSGDNYKIKYYPYNDLVLTSNIDTDTINAEYRLEYLDGRIEYFDAYGQLIQIEDRFGNAIKLTYDGKKLTKIECPNGTNITISYEETTEGYYDMTVTLPATNSNTSSNTIVYRFEEKLLSSGKSLWTLISKTDNRTSGVTEFSYEYKSTYLIYILGSKDDKYREALLTKVKYPTQFEAVYEYELASAPSKTEGGNDTQYSRISSKNLIYDSKTFNNETYTYSTSNFTGYCEEDEDFDGYSVTVENDNDLKTIYTFNELGANTRMATYIGSETKSINSKVMTYDTDDYDGVDYAYPNPKTITTGTLGTSGLEKIEYDTYGRVKKYWGPLSTISYNSRNNDTEYIVTYEYGEYNILKTKTYKQNSDTTIVETNNIGNKNGLENVITGSQITVNDVINDYCIYEYDSYGNVIKASAKVGSGAYQNTEYTYVSNNNYVGTVTKKARLTGEKDIIEAYLYNAFGNVSQYTDANNNVYKYTFDNMGNISKITNPDNSTKQYTYNYEDNIVLVTDENGHKLTYDYDPAGNLEQIVDVTGGNKVIEANEYDAYMRLTSNIKGEKTKTAYTYDANNRILSKAVSGTADDATELYKETYTYTANNSCDLITKIIVGNSDEYCPDMVSKEWYNNLGQLANQNVYGKATSYVYDYVGNAISQSRTAGADVTATDTYTYDHKGNVLTYKNSLGKVYTYTYDYLGRKTSVTDPKSTKTTYTYDNGDRLVEEAIPFDANNISYKKYEYDGNGNLTKETAGSSSDICTQTTYEYTVKNQLFKAIQLDNNSNECYTEYEYDKVGNLIKLITDNGNKETVYEYDQLNRVKCMTYPSGDAETYTYDLSGNMIIKKDRNGNEIHYDYDAMNRLTKEYSGSTIKCEYTYGATDRIISAKNSNIELIMHYNDKGLLWRLFYNLGNDKTRNIYYRYYNSGLCERKLITYEDYSSINEVWYSYDSENHLTSVGTDYNILNDIATYTYDNNGNLASSKYVENGITTTYSYNQANLITSLVNKKDSTTLSSYAYTYYLDGNQASKTSTINGTTTTTNYVYDKASRLVSESDYVDSTLITSKAYSYDFSGNRSKMVVSGSENYTIDYNYTPNNCLNNTVKTIPNQTKQEVVNYSYDKNGNLISMSEGSINPPKNINVVSFGIYTADELTLSYRENTYNEFNQLVKTMDNEGNVATYTYLANGLRWSKNVNGTETRFVWDNDNVFMEMDSNNIATNVYTRGVDLIKNNSNTFYLKNAHGDITQLANANGTVTKNYEYDAFGNESETDSTDTNPFRYCGEYFDDETGYVYLRNRYYDPSLGSFISEDTYWNTNNMIYGKSWDSEKPKVDVNAIKQSCNLYVYCIGNPVYYKDYKGNHVVVIGDSIAAQAGISVEGGVYVAFDDKGNIGSFKTVGGGIGFLGCGLNLNVGYFEFDTIYDLEELDTLSVSVSVSKGVDVGITTIITSDGVKGGILNAGAGCELTLPPINYSTQFLSISKVDGFNISDLRNTFKYYVNAMKESVKKSIKKSTEKSIKKSIGGFISEIFK